MSKSARNKDKPPHIANAKMLYLRLLRYAWRYKLVFALGIFSLIILSATNTGFLATIKQPMKALSNNRQKKQHFYH
jgi:ATP-binding cassette, subfamily B, bacterial MsbA